MTPIGKDIKKVTDLAEKVTDLPKMGQRKQQRVLSWNYAHFDAHYLFNKGVGVLGVTAR